MWGLSLLMRAEITLRFSTESIFKLKYPTKNINLILRHFKIDLITLMPELHCYIFILAQNYCHPLNFKIEFARHL